MQDTQMPPPSPPHVTTTHEDSVTVQDVPDTSSHNINPLTIEDLKQILHQTSLQEQLCVNPILVSVEELKKAIANITKEKLNLEEPPSHTQISTSQKSQEQAVSDIIAKFDSTKLDTSTVEEQEKKKTR